MFKQYWLSYSRTYYFFLLCLFFSIYYPGDSFSQVCANPETIIYGLDNNGLIVPITVSNAAKGTVLTNTTPGTTANQANGLGYSSFNSKFYYFWRNPGGSNVKFVSYDPSTNTYANLSVTGAPSNSIRTGSVTNDGRYFCTDILGNLYCYTISTDKWVTITNQLVDQNGDNVSALIQTYNTGDIAFDGMGNLWFVMAGNGKIGLYKINGPLTNASVSSMAITKILPTSTSTPDGKDAYGIAFNGSGDIFISTSSSLYLFNPNTLTFTKKGNLSNILDLTSCNFPMTVMPVRWLGLQVKGDDKNQIFVNWQVTDEINNKGYQVEMSLDGKNWKSFEVIAPLTKRDGQFNYNYSFFMTLKQSALFRIKQIDMDGKVTFSWIKQYVPEQISELNVWPNPVVNNLNIFSNGLIKTISIHHSNGTFLENIQLVNGMNLINLNHLKAGMYFIRYKSINEGIKMVRLIKN